MKTNFYSGFRNLFACFIFCLSLMNNTCAQTRLIGSTARIIDGFGAIYSIEPGATNFSTFIKINGSGTGNPINNRLVMGTNGKFYGNGTIGGFEGSGIIFEYDASTNKYTDKKDMTALGGETPEGSLTPLSPGKFLGHTSYGGLNGLGVIFEYDYLANTYTKKIDMELATGSYPLADLVRASNGKFYGITNLGGANDNGVIYEYDYNSNTYTKKVDMTSAGGYESAYSMIEAPNGKLYGTMNRGGANSLGVIFEYDFNTNTYTPRIDMVAVSGSRPEGGLLLAPNGKFYAATSAGGVGGRGVIYEYEYTTNTYTKKFDFALPANGERARGPLMLATNGKLYGVTSEGGTNNDGVVFEYDYLANNFTKKTDLVLINGKACIGGLAEAANGKLYATTNLGGNGNAGALFEYDFTNNIYTKMVDLGFAENGYEPLGRPCKASNDKIYFLTNSGGLYGVGAIIEYDPFIDKYTKRADLSGTDGANSFGGLTEGGAGKLYGITNKGGAVDKGTLFEFDYTSYIITKKKDFDGTNDGGETYGTMLRATNGKLYGTTQSGGAFNLGTLFEYDPGTNSFIKKIDFSPANGRKPSFELTMVSDGKIYGATTMGDVGLAGTLFDYDFNTNTLTTRLNLNGIDGESPSGAFVEDNGKLYGTTHYGGLFGKGVIFEWNLLTNGYQKKFDFNGTNGSYPTGIMKSQNGKSYGVTSFGGTNDLGTLFEYDQSTFTFTSKITFDLENNGYWPFSPPVEVDFSVVPLTLLDFKASRSGTNALLSWKTTNDINCNHIDIERSPDGDSFSFLGNVQAAGNSSSINNYSFTDKNVLPIKNFYRLKIVGNDGKFRYSDIRTVTFEKDYVVIVYPNPLRSQLNISFAGIWLDQPVSISLYNQLGQQVLSKKIDHVKQIESFSVGSTANGSYVLKLEQPKTAAVYKKIQVAN